jgi:hypothetical protein
MRSLCPWRRVRRRAGIKEPSGCAARRAVLRLAWVPSDIPIGDSLMRATLLPSASTAHTRMPWTLSIGAPFLSHSLTATNNARDPGVPLRELRGLTQGSGLRSATVRRRAGRLRPFISGHSRVRLYPRNNNLRRPSGIRAGVSIIPQSRSWHAKGIETRHLKYAMLRTLRPWISLGSGSERCIRANGGSQVIYSNFNKTIPMHYLTSF